MWLCFLLVIRIIETAFVFHFFSGYEIIIYLTLSNCGHTIYILSILTSAKLPSPPIYLLLCAMTIFIELYVLYTILSSIGLIIHLFLSGMAHKIYYKNFLTELNIQSCNEINMFNASIGFALFWPIFITISFIYYLARLE